MSGTFDRYGGAKARPLLGVGAVYRIAKRGRRFLLATPDGNAFWLKACYGIDITDGGETFVRALHAKYSSDATYRTWGYWWPFVAQAVRNLRQWGFNAIGEYSSSYALPIDTNNRGRGNSEKMPFIPLTNVVLEAKRRYGVKDLMYGVDEAVTPGLWRVEGFPDVFDPAFARAVDELTWPAQLPWLIGTSTDDRDYLFGFGPSRALGGWHNNLGWQTAATRPTQSRNERLWVGAKQGVTYTDTTVYAKLALRDHLRTKYRSLDQLNSAWGSRYTTWDSDGASWPGGRGFLDESGRSPWLGRDFYSLTDAAPAVRDDLDGFVGVIAERYFSVTVGALRSKRPGHLVFGPATISPAAHPEILRAAGRWCDAVQFSNEGVKTLRRGYSLVGKPFFVWTTFMAQADSPQASTKGWSGFDFPTQAERGRAYAQFLNELVGFRADDDMFPCIGIDWWAYCDKVTGGESHNFGLVTVRDNPYDGVAARVSKTRDIWGNPVGGETRDYGDFVNQVKLANDAVFEQMRDLAAREGSRRSSRSSLSLLPPLAVWLASRTNGPALTRRELLCLPGARPATSARPLPVP